MAGTDGDPSGGAREGRAGEGESTPGGSGERSGEGESTPGGSGGRERTGDEAASAKLEGGAAETSPTDPLHALEQRLERASAAAERLLAEAAWTAAERLAGGVGGARAPSGEERTAGGQPRPKPPPAGWQAPSEREIEGGASELLLRTMHRLEEMVPAELRRQLAEALRELLLALRALIDWCVERLERRRTSSTGLEDIPIL